MNINEEKIANMLGEILGIDDVQESITLDSQLVKDLGAESIDFIDICFQIEKMFKVGKVSTTEIFPEELKGGQGYSEDKLVEIVEKYPYVQGDLLEKIKNEKDFSPLLSVRAIYQFAEWRLANAK